MAGEFPCGVGLTGLQTATLLLVEALCGAGGALAARRLWRRPAFGWKWISAIGAVGGVSLALLAARIPGLANVIGVAESAIDATARGAGGLTPTVLVGVGIAGLLGGILSICLVGFLLAAKPSRD